MTINVIDPVSDSRWDKFIATQKDSTIFHTSSWAKLIKESYHYSPRYYVLQDESGSFKAGIPSYLVRSSLTGDRLICLPFSDFCCPLGNDIADIMLLFNVVKNEIEEGLASYLEIRGWQNENNLVQSNLELRDCNFRHYLDLELGVDTLKKNFHHSIKRGIHQAEKRDVTVRITRSEADLENFYKLNVTTRKKLGVLPQPHSFFQALYRHIISQNHGLLLVAEFDRKVIAGVVLLTYKDSVYYKFNASKNEYLRKRPNHAIIWEAIQYACANGYKYFDFGRCPFEEESLRIFKLRWGAEEIKLHYYYYPQAKGFSIVSENSLIYRSMRVFSYIMPKFVFRMAGSLLYKHLA